MRDEFGGKIKVQRLGGIVMIDSDSKLLILSPSAARKMARKINRAASAIEIEQRNNGN